jgi:predicted DNA-binding transcriptional regulator YafY
MLHQTKDAFEVPEEFDFEEFMRPSFGVFQGEPVKVKIWFSPDAAGYIREKIWHDTQEIVPQKDGSIIFEAEVAGTDEIRFWVMSWGSKAEVLEPESLREEIRKETEAVMSIYGEDRRHERTAS